MGQVLHGSAPSLPSGGRSPRGRPSEQVRGRLRAIQDSQESLRALSKRYGINPKTVAKWSEAEKQTWMDPCLPAERGRRSPIFRPGRKSRIRPCSRWRTKRSSSPSADTHCCRWTIASMRFSRPLRIHCLAGNCAANAERVTRSSLHRLFQRHDISRLPDLKSEAEPKRKFKRYPIHWPAGDAQHRREAATSMLVLGLDPGTQPSSASTMTVTTSSDGTFRPSSTHTTLTVGLRRSRASHRTNTSANSGLQSRIDSSSIQSIK